MKFEIGYTLPNGVEDTIIVEGETEEECRQKAIEAVELRHATDPWSREISP